MPSRTNRYWNVYRGEECTFFIYRYTRIQFLMNLNVPHRCGYILRYYIDRCTSTLSVDIDAINTNMEISLFFNSDSKTKKYNLYGRLHVQPDNNEIHNRFFFQKRSCSITNLGFPELQNRSVIVSGRLLRNITPIFL